MLEKENDYENFIKDIDTLLVVITVNHNLYNDGLIEYKKRQFLDEKAIKQYNKNCNKNLNLLDLMYNF